MHHTDGITQDLAIKKMLLNPYGSILILVVLKLGIVAAEGADSDTVTLMAMQVFQYSTERGQE